MLPVPAAYDCGPYRAGPGSYHYRRLIQAAYCWRADALRVVVCWDCAFWRDMFIVCVCFLYIYIYRSEGLPHTGYFIPGRDWDRGLAEFGLVAFRRVRLGPYTSPHNLCCASPTGRSMHAGIAAFVYRHTQTRKQTHNPANTRTHAHTHTQTHTLFFCGTGTMLGNSRMIIR